MKKAFSLLLSCIMILTMVACGSKTTPDGESKANDYPSKNINIVVPYGAGGGTDIVVRQLVAIMEKQTGNQFTVTNKPGGGGATGSAEVAGSAPDGYTILANDKALVSSYYMGVSQTNWENDLDTICRLDSNSMVLVVPGSSPYNSVQDLIDAAKAAPDTLTIGVSGMGGISHLVAEAFLAASGAQIKVVGYDGGSDNMAAVTGAQVTCSVIQCHEASPLVASKDLKALAVPDDERSVYLPDTPTFKEEGIDCVLMMSRYLWAPKGTDPEVIAYLADAVKNAMESQEFEDFLVSRCAIGSYLGTSDTIESLKADDAFLKNLVETAGLAQN